MWNENLEDLIIVKRSGQRVEFNASKIAIAIKKAFESFENSYNEKDSYKVFEKVLSYINREYVERKTINVEDIQDIIEKTLKDENYNDVCLSFHNYRTRRSASRKVFEEKQQHKFLIAVEKIGEKNKKNYNLSPNEILNLFAKTISREYAKSYILDNKYVRSLEEGNIFIHNLDYFSLGYISYLHMKSDTNNGDIDEVINAIINASSEVNNNIGINDIDLLISDYVLNRFREDLYKNINSYLRLFGLADFISLKKYELEIKKMNDIGNYDTLKDIYTNDRINYILKEAIRTSEEELDLFIISSIKKIFDTLIGRNSFASKYSITISDNDSIVLKKIKEYIIEYLNKKDYINNIHVILELTKNTNTDYLNKIIDLIIKKKNVALSINSEKNCKYLEDGIKIYDEYNNFSSGRMQVASASINMARLSLKCKGKSEDFYIKLNDMMEFVKNELILVFETIGDKNKENYKFLFIGNIYGDERLENGQKIRKVLKIGTLSIGLVGLGECIKELSKDSKNEKKLLFDILEFLNKKCQEFSAETKLNFNIFEPSSNHVRERLLKIDKTIYGELVKPLENDKYGLLLNSKIIQNYPDILKIEKYFGGGIKRTIFYNSANTEDLLKILKENMQNFSGYMKIEVKT